MEDFARANVPGGISEDDIWAVLHAENIKRGGEWIETRLLASGPAPTPGSRNAGRGSCRTTKSSPSTPI